VPHLLFSDDIKIFCRISSIDDCHRLQNNILLIMNWCEVNNLKVNVAKCNFMSFSKRKKPIIYDYKIDGSVLTRRVVVKELGVTFDSKLSFVPHIRSVVSSCFKTNGFVVRNSIFFFESSTLITLFSALVRSKIEYASVVWFPSYNSHILTVASILR
jgi:hypothetical protein